MTKHLKELLSRRKHFNECKKALESEIYIYKIRIEDRNKALQEVIAAGDPAKESILITAISHYEKVISEAQIRLEDYVKSSGIDPKEIKAAWAEYAEHYNAEFLKKEKAFIKARRSLEKLFNELVTMQNDALFTRIQCGAMLDIVPRESVDQDKYYSMLKKIRTIPVDDSSGGCPELVYFSAYNQPEQKQRQRYRDIIFSHKPNYPEND